MSCNSNKCSGKIAPSCPKPTPQGWGNNVFFGGPTLGSIRTNDDFDSVIIKLYNMIQGCTAPAVTSQPVSTSVVLGHSFTLTAGFSGTNLAIQWFKNGIAISGATNLSYTVLVAESSDLGSYYATATNDCGTATTNTVTVAEGTTNTFYYGFNADGSIPSDPATLQFSGTFASGGDITANYSSVVDPSYMIMAEPSTEPVKTTWKTTEANTGVIDSAAGGSNLFYYVISGSTRFYLTNYPTLFPTDPVIFQI